MCAYHSKMSCATNIHQSVLLQKCMMHMAVAPVLFCGGGNRALVAHPVQFYDLAVFHFALPSFRVKAFHLYRQQKSSFIARTGKLFTNLSYHAGAAISTGLRPRITAWALKKLMQSTLIYRASGVAGYQVNQYPVLSQCFARSLYNGHFFSKKQGVYL